MTLPAAGNAHPPHDVRRGLALGLLAVALFALTFPMTRLAVGDVNAPQLSPAFVTAGRAALAGLLAVLYLSAVRAPWPPREVWPALTLCAAGTVLGFPLFIGLALREVPSVHAAVVSGIIPLATAAVAAVHTGQRPSAGFWLCALAGCGLVLTFALWSGGGRWVAADGWLLAAVGSTALAYVAGAHAAQRIPPYHVVCWVVVGSLPLTLPAAWLTRPEVSTISWAAWAGLLYVSVFSMWLGFFAWYRALALGGIVRVSQVQLLQPFLALLFAVPLLGEQLHPITLGFAMAVAAVVFVGRRLPVDHRPAGGPSRP